MRHPEGPRFLRRLRARQQAAEAAQQQPDRRAHPDATLGPADPRSGTDRRQAERRNPALTPAQVEARMRALGITADRRRGDRRR